MRSKFLPVFQQSLLLRLESTQAAHHKPTAPSPSPSPSPSPQQQSEERICLTSTENGIKRIILNNSKKRNALSYAMMLELFKEIADMRDRPRVIVISAHGPVFSSGHDLRELKKEHGSRRHEEIFRTCTELMCAVENCEVPVIAQVNGLAAAAGCQLVASCDLVVASSNSTFSVPGVYNGLFCSTPGIPLVRAVPLKIAAKLLYTGEPITAAEALQHGLVSSVVEEAELEKETIRLAHRICQMSPAVIAVGKKFLRAQVEMDRKLAYQEGERVMVSNLALSDGQEGIAAFLEKRKAKWS
ncbi:Enoyl-CoA hydratase domain-containing protein 3, mitochondrial [Hypsibius exemplaris]|uniref:Enoyl-CoA hydratase domain-containing protein 3, mitochondrial n=1 Tax=Hypsibius exemplaris TaxID=2072580 RepID=A0A1W0WY32_HYPEX|nr:Enoyl-CoA hydratase domain-containing protein 3, mitochondrial [Hypsibius exemplaris]